MTFHIGGAYHMNGTAAWHSADVAVGDVTDVCGVGDDAADGVAGQSAPVRLRTPRRFSSPAMARVPWRAWV